MNIFQTYNTTLVTAPRSQPPVYSLQPMPESPLSNPPTNHCIEPLAVRLDMRDCHLCKTESGKLIHSPHPAHLLAVQKYAGGAQQLAFCGEAVAGRPWYASGCSSTSSRQLAALVARYA